MVQCPAGKLAGFFMRGKRLFVIGGYVALGSVFVPSGYAGISIANRLLYPWYCVWYVWAGDAAHDPVHPQRFAAYLAGIAALILIGLFAAFRPVRTIGPLIALWSGVLLGVLWYGALVLWPWLLPGSTGST